MWLAVTIIPPFAENLLTDIPNVGVVVRSMLITLIPYITIVFSIIFKIYFPDFLESLPITMLKSSLMESDFTYEQNEEVNSIISIGVRLSSTPPPIVPLIPAIELIKVILDSNISIVYVWINKN